MTNCKCGCECHKIEKKSLAEKMKEISQYSDLSWEQVYRKQAKAAVEHFCELVDEAWPKRGGAAITNEELKKKFRESA